MLAPYPRKFGQLTIPDLLGARYGGNLAEFVGMLGGILVWSFLGGMRAVTWIWFSNGTAVLQRHLTTTPGAI